MGLKWKIPRKITRFQWNWKKNDKFRFKDQYFKNIGSSCCGYCTTTPYTLYSINYYYYYYIIILYGFQLYCAIIAIKYDRLTVKRKCISLSTPVRDGEYLSSKRFAKRPRWFWRTPRRPPPPTCRGYKSRPHTRCPAIVATFLNFYSDTFFV